MSPTNIVIPMKSNWIQCVQVYVTLHFQWANVIMMMIKINVTVSGSWLACWSGGVPEWNDREEWRNCNRKVLIQNSSSYLANCFKIPRDISAASQTFSAISVLLSILYISHQYKKCVYYVHKEFITIPLSFIASCENWQFERRNKDYMCFKWHSTELL